MTPQTPEGWAAEWQASAALQAEYPTAAGYVATMKRRAHRAVAGASHGSHSGKPDPSSDPRSAASVPQTPEVWTAEWHARADLQAEYLTAAGYVAIMRRKVA